MAKYRKNSSVNIQVVEKGRRITISNNLGVKWTFPKPITFGVALSSMITSTIIREREYMTTFSDSYKITLDVEEL